MGYGFICASTRYRWTPGGVAHNLLDIKAFLTQFLADSGSKEQDDGLLSQTEASIIIFIIIPYISITL